MKRPLILIAIFAVLLLFLFSINIVVGAVFSAILISYIYYKGLPLIYLFRANKKYSAKQVAEALSLYKKAASLKRSSPQVKSAYAYVLMRQGELDKAEEILNKLLQLPLVENDKIIVSLNYSIALWKSNRLPEAIKLLEEIYNKGNKTTTMYQNLGFYYIINGDLEKSLDFNLEAYDYNDSDTSIMDNLALNYYLMDKYDEADELYNKLIPMNPTFPSAYYYYALLLKKRGDYKKALEMLTKASECTFSSLSFVTKAQIEEEIREIENSKYSLD